MQRFLFYILYNRKTLFFHIPFELREQKTVTGEDDQSVSCHFSSEIASRTGQCGQVRCYDERTNPTRAKDPFFFQILKLITDKIL